MQQRAYSLEPRDAAATPVLLEQAERMLALVRDADDAEVLWRKLSAIDEAARLAKVHGDVQLQAGRLKLRAERRWGELLGPAEHGGSRDQVSSGNLKAADRAARHKAREVAAVPEPVFEKYLGAVRDGERLRRQRLFRLAREHEAEKRRSEPVASVVSLAGAEIRHGDFREVLADLSDVDAIITDPPYPQEFLDEYDALGEFAARALKPDGILAVMVGQTHLPAYLNRLTRHVSYRWCGAYMTEGPATRIHARSVGTKWKPILIFGGSRFLTQDVFASQADDKRHHRWGQSESGFADLIERLTEPGELVVDPFTGGGTTAIVCRDLGRQFIGCDLDAAAVHGARERLAA